MWSGEQSMNSSPQIGNSLNQTKSLSQTNLHTSICKRLWSPSFIGRDASIGRRAAGKNKVKRDWRDEQRLGESRSNAEVQISYCFDIRPKHKGQFLKVCQSAMGGICTLSKMASFVIRHAVLDGKYVAEAQGPVASLPCFRPDFYAQKQPLTAGVSSQRGHRADLPVIDCLKTLRTECGVKWTYHNSITNSHTHHTPRQSRPGLARRGPRESWNEIGWQSLLIGQFRRVRAMSLYKNKIDSSRTFVPDFCPLWHLEIKSQKYLHNKTSVQCWVDDRGFKMWLGAFDRSVYGLSVGSFPKLEKQYFYHFSFILFCWQWNRQLWGKPSRCYIDMTLYYMEQEYCNIVLEHGDPWSFIYSVE